jgi:hypothetical protein
MLTGCKEKAPCQTDQNHYIIYDVRGGTYLTHGDWYEVPCADAPLGEGFVAEVPRANRYWIKDAGATLHTAFLRYRTRASATPV